MLTAADGYGRGGVITLSARDDGTIGVRYQDMLGGRPADFVFDRTAEGRVVKCLTPSSTMRRLRQ